MTVVTTGMPGLDSQLGGGVPRGTTLLLVADPSNAIALFAEQFSAGGLGTGETVLYFEFDRPAWGAAQQVRALANGSGVRGKLSVFDGYSSQFATGRNGHKDEGVQRLDRDKVLTQILNQVMALPPGAPYRLVLNSLSSLTRRNEEEVLDFVRNLVHLGHELEGVQLITLVRGLHSPSFETGLKHIAGGVMEMGHERKGFGMYSFLQVTKLLDVPDATRLLLFRETDKGLWLESTKRVF